MVGDAVTEITKDSLQIARLEEQLSSMRHTLEKMDERMEAMETQLAEARGGWRTLVWLGGAAASMGAAMSWVVSHVRFQ